MKEKSRYLMIFFTVSFSRFNPSRKKKLPVKFLEGGVMGSDVVHTRALLGKPRVLLR